MGPICLSSASILRCDSLTRNQNIYLIIPTALEIIFSTSLVFIDRGPGKRNLLLTAEGFFFLILAFLELLSQILPAVRGNLRLFKAFDLAIGIASILPISAYTLFIYLLTNAEITSALSRRIKNIAKPTLILLILAIIIFNEITAFINVSIQNISASKPTEAVVAVGFSSSTQRKLWMSFTSATLALLFSLQVAVFSFSFFWLTQDILDRRRIESQRNEKAHVIRGIGWITGALMIGAIETVIGFAGGGFGVVFTRRVLRLLARASLCIGVAKGVGVMGEFGAMRNQLSIVAGSKFRRSQIHEFISNPRSSTFRQLSPKAAIAHAAQRASDIHDKSATYVTLTAAGLPCMEHFADVRAQNGCQRVTVQYDQGKPTLHMRLSLLDIPSPTTIVEETQSGPQSDTPRLDRKSVFRDSTDSVPSFSEPFELVTAPRRMLSQRSARARLYQTASPATSPSPYSDPGTSVEPREQQDIDCMRSMRSTTDSFQAVQDLTDQFPGPPLASKNQNTSIISSVTEKAPIEVSLIPQALGSPSELRLEEQGDIFPSYDSSWSNNYSSKQPTLYTVTGTTLKPAPLYSENPFNDDEEEDTISPSRIAIADKETPDATASRSRHINSLHDSEAGSGDSATAIDTGISWKLQPLRGESPHSVDEKVTPTTECKSRATSHLPQAETSSTLHSHERDMSMDHLTVPWSKSADIEEEAGRLVKAMAKDIPLSRVKSIGKAPRKFTPLPIQASPGRGSMHLKPIVVPPRGGNMPGILNEFEDGSLELTPTGEKDTLALGTP